MILSAIAAMAKNRVIGLNNQLPWHLPEDLKYFREKTKNKIIIMGRKTFDSFNGKPLPNRFHIVITRNPNFRFDHPMVKTAASLDEALALAQGQISEFSDEVFIIGGGEIYTQSLPKLDRLYLTIIDRDYAGDAYFPEFDQKRLPLFSSEKRSGEIPFSFNLYQRLGL